MAACHSSLDNHMGPSSNCRDVDKNAHYLPEYLSVTTRMPRFCWLVLHLLSHGCYPPSWGWSRWSSPQGPFSASNHHHSLPSRYCYCRPPESCASGRNDLCAWLCHACHPAAFELWLQHLGQEWPGRHACRYQVGPQNRLLRRTVVTASANMLMKRDRSPPRHARSIH